MFPDKFDTLDQIESKIKRVGAMLDPATFRNVSRVYYEALKICYLKLKRKQKIGKSGRQPKGVSLGRADVTRALILLDYFHSNDNCERIKIHSSLAGCYNPSFCVNDAERFCREFIVGEITDRFGFRVRFTEDFHLCLYKSEGKTHAEAAMQEGIFNASRAKRLPMVRHTVISTTNVLQRIDSRGNLERMYIYRYVDHYDTTFFQVVIAEKNYRDKLNPFIAKTAFPIFDFSPLLHRIEQYEPPNQQ